MYFLEYICLCFFQSNFHCFMRNMNSKQREENEDANICVFTGKLLDQLYCYPVMEHNFDQHLNNKKKIMQEMVRLTPLHFTTIKIIKSGTCHP